MKKFIAILALTLLFACETPMELQTQDNSRIIVYPQADYYLYYNPYYTTPYYYHYYNKPYYVKPPKVKPHHPPTYQRRNPKYYDTHPNTRSYPKPQPRRR